MRRVALALVLCALWALPAPVVEARRAVAIVQDLVWTGNVNDNVVTITEAAAGNVLVVLGHVLHATQTLTISDNGGSTWNACPAVRALTGHQVGIWWAVAASGVTQVTLTSGGGSANTGGFILEASGMGSPTCDGTDEDSTSGGTSHGGGISLAPSTTTEALIVGAVVSSSSATYSATPATYTTWTGAPTVNAWAGYKLVTSTDANLFASTSSSSEDTLTTLATIMSQPAGGGSGPRLLGLLGVGF